MTIDQAIGWFGSICFMLSGIPQAYQSLKYKSSGNMNLLFLTLWILGASFCCLYSILLQNLPLFCNYSVNLVCVSIIFYYRLRPKPITKVNIFPLRRKRG